jgi:hypothetical protein
MKNIFTSSILLLISLSCFGTTDYAGKDTMNGISFSEYEKFPETWQLVTIRFRKDTGEMRLTYANPLAMKTLLSGSINYPDGSVFAKTGIHTGIDEQFVSSVVPKGIRRYQLMVKNKTKYASTGGWGYGLFDSNGKTFPENPVETQNACYACHTIVENRGDVFSQAFSFISKIKSPKLKLNDNSSRVSFLTKKWELLPEVLKSVVPQTFKSIRWLEHSKLRQNVFQGTLDELKPILEEESNKHRTASTFISKDLKKFVVVMPGKSDKCMGMGAFKVVSTTLDGKTVAEEYCTHD